MHMRQAEAAPLAISTSSVLASASFTAGLLEHCNRVGRAPGPTRDPERKQHEHEFVSSLVGARGSERLAHVTSGGSSGTFQRGGSMWANPNARRQQASATDTAIVPSASTSFREAINQRAS